MEFEYIRANSIHLPNVIELGKKHSNTLGFMPEGGYLDHAKKGHILIAKENNDLVGYILFRIAIRTNILSIAHLCISEGHRNKKIAVQLLDQLKIKYENDLSGILLSCREDYLRPCKLWRQYGFVAKNKIRSRSQEEKYLIRWWYSFNQNDLFSTYDIETKRSVLLDMNILIKLRDKNLANYIEVQPLLADWLADEVEYYYAQEFYNEIIRDSNKDRTNQTRTFVQSYFKEAKLNKDRSKTIYNNIKKYFKNNKINDDSDIRQISDCISANIKYFITLDKEILSFKNKIEEHYDLIILSPAEFILKIDMLINDTEYQPCRLAGVNHIINKIESGNLDTYINEFIRNDRGETKENFRNKINKLILNIPLANIHTVENESKKPIAIWGYLLTNDSIKVELIRTFHDNLETTLFTQLIFEIINIAINKQKFIIDIPDDYFCEAKSKILVDFGFINYNSIWRKIVIKDLIESSELFVKYPFLNQFLNDQLKDLLINNNEDRKLINLYNLERILYPIKFKDLEIPCYIIPIKRFWAGQLFDKYNSNGDFFGANPNKMWNKENVYYRSIKPVMEKFPARILWYVSSQKNQNRQMSIVATSYINHVSVDDVKTQFKKFRKYGIYEWKDIFKLAKYDLNNKVKAIEFSHTEVFQKELHYEKITKILLENNLRKNTFVSPVKIPSSVFNDLYQRLLG